MALPHGPLVPRGRIQDFGLGGALAGDLGDGSPQGRGPVRVWGRAGRSPKNVKSSLIRLKKTTYGEKKQVHTD